LETESYGAITTSLKSVVNHERKRIPKGKGCKQSARSRGGRVANKPKDGFLSIY
jgi:hypothetical protein